ncbi:MAG: S4 domain-containing protein, partial [Candidatus Sericytochromatia bacterium]|nr:S4 domain-containing protein [Candidatus Sericytochromatia bacterium]
MTSSGRQRLDQRVVAEGLYPSREAARRGIMAGEVRVGDEPATKPGTWVPDDRVVRRVTEPMPWVSRGGYKLDHALS